MQKIIASSKHIVVIGVEPMILDSESNVLPLDHTTINARIRTRTWNFRFVDEDFFQLDYTGINEGYRTWTYDNRFNRPTL